jgi:hypothetical protein
MAIKKPGSRFTDRNKIRKMHREGYSVRQIAEAVSIVEEHVQYVLENWDADEEAWRNRELAARQAALDEAHKAATPENAPPSIDDQERARIREQARQELMAEFKQADPPAEEPPVNVEEETADEAAPEEAEEEPKKPRRRRRKEGDDE